MAIAHVQDAAGTGGGTTVTVTISTTAGNTLFLAAISEINNTSSPAAPTSVTDSASQTWTLVTGIASNDGSSGQGRCDGAFIAGSAAITSATIHFPSSVSQRDVSVSEFSGMPASVALDGSGATVEMVSGTSITTTSISTAKNGDVAMAIVASLGNWSPSTAGYTGIPILASGNNAAWKILGAPSTESCTFTASSSFTYAVMTFAAGGTVAATASAVNMRQAVKRASLW